MPLIHFRRRIVPLGIPSIRRVLSLTRDARVILPSAATWLDRAMHPFASFNALTAILLFASFGALTALFNSSNSEVVLIISALFAPYLHSLFLHPFFLHPFFLHPFFLHPFFLHPFSSRTLSLLTPFLFSRPFSSHEGFFQRSLPSLDSCVTGGPYAFDNPGSC